MSIQDYHFDQYNETALRHIAEGHLQGAHLPGSQFLPERFPSAEAVVAFVLQLLEHQGHLLTEYDRSPVAEELEAGETIGYDAIVELDSVPAHAETRTEARGLDGFQVSVVSGIEKPPTSKLVVVAGPLEGQPEKHGFYTIHPGKKAPPFPFSETTLRQEGFEGEALAKTLAENEQYAEFWHHHGLIGESK